MGSRPRFDERQLQLARLAPARVKVEKEHAAARLGNAEGVALQTLVNRRGCRVRAGGLERARRNEDLPDGKPDC
jgi:hypothetical protein